MTNNIIAIENKVNELAEQVIPAEGLNSFKNLPLSEKVFGIKFFATIAKDAEIVRLCEAAESYIAQGA